MSKTKEVNITRRYCLIDLQANLNNDGISYDELKSDGDFDGAGATYPAEELPPSNSQILVGQIPFYFPSKESGSANNMVFAGQTITVPKNVYTKLHVLGAVEGRNGEVYEEEITLSHGEGEYHPIFLGLSNWLLSPAYEEKIAFECSHIHFPDEGQQTISNNKSVALDYESGSSNQEYDLRLYSDELGKYRREQQIWTPKIYYQTVPIELLDPIEALTLMDNLNVHIFAMTLQVA